MHLVSDLERNSQVLDRIGDSFSRLLDKRTFKVWSFVEELPMAGGENVDLIYQPQISVSNARLLGRIRGIGRNR
jgi:hypothetical protein